jgi:hypothetical protein
MSLSIFDYVKNSDILEYARTLNRESLLGMQLFPTQDTLELNYEYLKGAYGTKNSIMAEVVPWETSTPLRPREGFDKVTGELPPIKLGTNISEQELIKIFSPRVTAERQRAISKLYDDVADLVDGVYARINYINMQALGTGSVVFNSEYNKLTVSFGVPGNHILTPSTKWSTTTTSTPITDLMAWSKVLTDAGYPKPDTFLTSGTVMAFLLLNKEIKDAVFSLAGGSGILTAPTLNNFLRSLDLPRIATYDEVHRVIGADRTLSTVRAFPEKNGTLFSSKVQLGNTLFGPTAEAISSVGVERAPGVYADITKHTDPVSHKISAVATAFPTFPGADAIIIGSAVIA